MTYLCPRPCLNKTADGYCRSTWCINPQFSDFGTCQEVIFKAAEEAKPKQTYADRVRAMTDEELAEWFHRIQYDVSDYYCGCHSCEPTLPTGKERWLGWLKQEAQCTSE